MGSKIGLLVGALLAVSLVAAQEPRQDLPRFRAGANLVRLDAYVTQNGVPLTDLKAEDFEVLEDNVPQRVESFELIRPRGPVAETARVEPRTVAESRAMAEAPDARVFVLFMDVWHVHVEGSYFAKSPIVNLLEQVIGQDDLVGVMTPEMAARNVTLARRTKTISGILEDNWYWGERGRVVTSDPKEAEYRLCYPDPPRGAQTSGWADEMIDRRRERKTLDAMEDLVTHLEGIREERKFIIMLSEGWLWPRHDDRLTQALIIGPNDEKYIPGITPIGVGPEGKLTTGGQASAQLLERCERDRLRIAHDDLQAASRTLLQRANRANVSFYTIDPRGLVVFDETLVRRRALNISGDRARLGTRQTALRELAETTDGFAILNTDKIEDALRRMVADVGSYYLVGYYSTNTRLDGKFRKLTVRVKRPGVDVRARPGYLAPTEAEAAAARVDRLMNGAPPGHSDTPPELRRALERLTPGRNAPVRFHAVGGPGRLWMLVEFDAATLKLAEWQQGGRARIFIEHERNATSQMVVDAPLEAGQRALTIVRPESSALPPGRYVIRLSLTPNGSTIPIQTTVDAFVPEPHVAIALTGVASRRGPSTGLSYVSTADPRFRRTERLRFEVPRIAATAILEARLLSRDGQPLAVIPVVSERVDEASNTRFAVVDLTLAPLAQGDYVLEVSGTREGKKDSAVYAFRIVP